MNLQECNLLRRRIFFPLFLTQFCGAFNDNAFKLSMLTLISYYLTKSQSASEYYQVIASALFIFPFFIFSATAGQLADKYDKATLTRIIKFSELLLMLTGSFGLLHGNIVVMMLVLMGMGLHSTFFGPIKYAILPDHLLQEQLLPATALIEASTFMAILLGTTLGALAIGSTGKAPVYSIVLINGLAITGLVASFFIPKAPSISADLKIDWQVWRSTKAMLQITFNNRAVLPVVLSISWFWLIGAVLLTKLPDYVHYVLNADTTVFALFLALFSIGIALGSLAISRFLAGLITVRYVPLAMLLLSLFAFDIYWATPIEIFDTRKELLSFLSFLFSLNHLRIVLDFFLFSFCGGLFIVPLYTYLQVSCEDKRRARVIAANNIVSAVAMVSGSVLVMVMMKLKLTIAFVFLVLAVCNAIAAVLFWFTAKTKVIHHRSASLG
ncbi:MAG: 2-acyl-glycerophospho-ethanolamine acyltransferase [Legionellales bacterium RIFCSPHIGHO2_12_FULL_42_9]|nr:MAG: 2-acyl-glycerophospho-ethanolamine acyltransferase [Legionellales bacterium RIFCSPHIGHO2_12_FULL_42_9]